MSEIIECSSSSDVPPSRQLHVFSLEEIEKATNNFSESNRIGSGGFAEVYLAIVQINPKKLIPAAVKRMNLAKISRDDEEFWNEIRLLSKVHHCNLVNLLGYCSSKTEKLLVYEYVEGITLTERLHTLSSRLSWIYRLKICISAGEGLIHLHEQTGEDTGIIHGDVKSDNIMLRDELTAKICDFGLSRICNKEGDPDYVDTLAKGSCGYMDPTFPATNKLKIRSDVFSYGMTLFEVLSKKKPMDKELTAEGGALEWVRKHIDENNMEALVDPEISREISPAVLEELGRILYRCFEDVPDPRPTMVEVVSALKQFLLTEMCLLNKMVLVKEETKKKTSSSVHPKKLFQKLATSIKNVGKRFKDKQRSSTE